MTMKAGVAAMPLEASPSGAPADAAVGVATMARAAGIATPRSDVHSGSEAIATASATVGGDGGKTCADGATADVDPIGIGTEEPTCDANPVDGETAPPLSKADIRRLRKQQRKEERKITNKEKMKLKKERQKTRRKEARRNMLGEMTEEERAIFLEKEKAEAQARQDADEAVLQEAFDTGSPKVVINCSFSDIMSHKELVSLAKQSQLCYGLIKTLKSTIQLHLTSVNDDNNSLPWFKAIGYTKWKVHVHEKSVWELFDPSTMVVLSPDADDELDTVHEDRIYVIGGLVDRSIQKMQSRAQAEEHAVPCMRKLPVKRFGPKGVKPVLNIDVVVRALAMRLRGADWESIFLECLPQRQQGGPSNRTLKKERRLERKTAAAAGASAEGAVAAGEAAGDKSEVSSDSSGDEDAEEEDAVTSGSEP
eukprot:TRINITY_DN67333_c0_g1_i1.p1 TRINITY_DN67333_c0_g1~~TRINITY_DN67333_c0_g1_i1.p1  ORF type:complete len:422 (-),score=117.88 TRINITY_DN67333_c0_g1_i1:66-1331(-)